MTEIGPATEINNAKLNETIGNLFGVEPASIKDDSSHDTIENWDSFGMINLIQELEAVFEVEFELLEIADFKDVGAVKEILRRKGVII